MTKTVRPASSYKERAVSGLAGASGGLGLVSLAKSLPSSAEPLPALLIYASPFVTVFVSSVWTIGIMKLRRRSRRRTLEASLRSAGLLRDQIVANPDSSAKINRQAQASLESIQGLVMELNLQDTRDTSTFADLLPLNISTDTQGVTSNREPSQVQNS